MSNQIDYKANLLLAMDELKKCQESKNSNSCMGCEKFFECDIRKNYVKAAFDKMCEGEDKGFAF